MTFEKVMGRIEDILSKDSDAKIYSKDIADALGISPSQYSNLKSRNSIPYQKVSEFCAREKISINWVLYGQTMAMLKSEDAAGFQIKLFNDINGSAGGGAFNDNEDYTYFSLDPAYVKLLGVTSNDVIEAINVMGESMEPTLRNGSIVLIDRNKTNIISGGIFAINAGGNLYIKRLSFNPKGGIDLISDNPAIPVQNVAADEAFVVGKIIGALEKV